MNDTTLVVRETFETMLSKAETLVKSGFLPKGVDSKEKALAIMTMAQELGIGMWAGFNGINVIQGKPTISPQLMLALINRSGQLEDMTIEADSQQATVTMKRKGRTAHIETFTLQDAQRILTKEWVEGKPQIIVLSEKYNWKQMPAIMLKWRAVAACARVVFPDAVLGFYTPEEIDPDVDIDPDSGAMTPRPINVKSISQDADGQVIETDVVSEIPHLAEEPTAPSADVSNGGMTDLLERPMSSLKGPEVYRVRQYSMTHSGTNHERHWDRRFEAKFGKVALFRIPNLTVAEFIEAMGTPSGQADDEAA